MDSPSASLYTVQGSVCEGGEHGSTTQNTFKEALALDQSYGWRQPATTTFSFLELHGAVHCQKLYEQKK